MPWGGSNNQIGSILRHNPTESFEAGPQFDCASSRYLYLPAESINWLSAACAVFKITHGRAGQMICDSKKLPENRIQNVDQDGRSPPHGAPALAVSMRGIERYRKINRHQKIFPKT
jgi:hypothetical protein